MANVCLICGGNNLDFIRKYRSDSARGKQLFGKASLYNCCQCELVQMAPLPAPQELAHYYASDYRVGGRYGAEEASVDDFPKDNLFYFNRGESIAELLTPYLRAHANTPKLRILDVGAGFGHILHSLGRRHPSSERFAIEISQVAFDHLRSIGVQVFTTCAEELLPRTKQRFDLIIMSHLLEHLSNPAATLEILRQSLAPNGLLYIEVPYIPVESLTRWPDNKWAPRVDEPHLTFFTIDTLQSLLTKSGYGVLFCETSGPEYEYISWLRFHLPKFQPLVLKLLPLRLKTFLRRQSFTKPLRVHERENAFYKYGGFRLWIRSISSKEKS